MRTRNLPRNPVHILPKPFARRLPLLLMPILTSKLCLPNSSSQLPSAVELCLHNTLSTQAHKHGQHACNSTALHPQTLRDHRCPKQPCQPRFAETQQRSNCGHRFGPRPQYPHPTSSQTCLQPSKSVTTSKLQQRTLPTPAILQAIKHRQSSAKPAELDGAQRTPQSVSLALHHKSQEKRYPDDRHIIFCIRTYPPSSDVRVILALDEF